LAITSIIHAVASIRFIRGAADHGISEGSVGAHWDTDFRLRSFLFFFSSTSVGPNSIDVSTRVPSRRWWDIFVSWVVATHKTITSSNAAVRSISAMPVVHDDSVSSMDRRFGSSSEFPSSILSGLEVRPEIFANTFIAISPASMNHAWVVKEVHSQELSLGHSEQPIAQD
jgi:hypothetical protein